MEIVAHRDNPNFRYYRHKGKLYPSVTSILAATRSQSEKDKLRKWQHKLDKVHGKGRAATEVEESRARGTAIHNAISGYLLKGDQPSLPAAWEPYWLQVQGMVSSLDATRIDALEIPVAHQRLEYAGTLDLLTNWRERLTLIDWKTSGRLKRKSWIKEYCLQAIAYKLAYEYEKGEAIEQIIIAVASPQRLQLFEIESSEIEPLTVEWKKRLVKFAESYG